MPPEHRTPRFTIDSSALLAMMEHAPGGSVIGAKLHHSAISALSLVEVLDISRRRGIDTSDMVENLQSLGLHIEPFLPQDALPVTHIIEASEPHQLSLVDAACLALARRLGIPVLTTDASWSDLSVGVEVQVLR